MGTPGRIVHGMEKPKNNGHSETFTEVQLLLTRVLFFYMSILHVCTQISKAKGEQLLEEDAVVVAKAYFPPPLVAKLT